ncbi:hypothetical protein ACS0PU_009180 [Formica fusca]
MIGRRLQYAESSAPTVSSSVKTLRSTEARVKTKRVRKEYLLIVQWEGGRSAADSDEFRRRILIPFDLSAWLFSALRPGSLVTSEISIPEHAAVHCAIEGFSARKRTKKKSEKKRRGKDARQASQRINGCLEASRRLAPAANTSRMNNSSTT